ncbi:MAG: haloacid dehalogenase [Desulfobacca sp.]|nr:haloacid dehalogenase [Desulfobacca sp.]
MLVGNHSIKNGKNRFMNAVLFDIDGTLLDSTDLDRSCYIKAVRAILGEVTIRTEWCTYKEVTALAILKEILCDNNIAPDSRTLEAVRLEFGRTISATLQDGHPCRAREGALGTIDFLQENEGVQVGLATGDWSHTARLKLASGGLKHEELPLSSSDQSEKRIEIMKDALGKLQGPFQDIFYVGDGEWDLKASQELGWNFIGVGPRLRGRCDPWYEAFSYEFRKWISPSRQSAIKSLLGSTSP